MRSHRLQQRRIRLGLTQGQLAQHIGVSQYVVSASEAIDAGRDPARYTVDLKRIPELRNLLLYLETRPRCRRETLRREGERIARQRALWAALPDHPSVLALKAAMLARALDLMHEGKGSETDAIAEFLPEGDVEAMFEQWEKESNDAHVSKVPE